MNTTGGTNGMNQPGSKLRRVLIVGAGIGGPVLGLWLRDRLLPQFLRLGAAAQSKSYAYRLRWDGP